MASLGLGTLLEIGPKPQPDHQALKEPDSPACPALKNTSHVVGQDAEVGEILLILHGVGDAVRRRGESEKITEPTHGPPVVSGIL
jgi:hypothetical protein